MQTLECLRVQRNGLLPVQEAEHIPGSIRDDLVTASLNAGLTWCGGCTRVSDLDSDTIHLALTNAPGELITSLTNFRESMPYTLMHGLPFAMQDVLDSVHGPANIAFLLRSGKIVRLDIAAPSRNACNSKCVLLQQRLTELMKQSETRNFKYKRLEQRLQSAKNKVFPVPASRATISVRSYGQIT